MFTVEAATYEEGPFTREGSALEKGRAQEVVNDLLWRGYWVEVYMDDTGELVAGPFDPDADIQPNW